MNILSITVDCTLMLIYGFYIYKLRKTLINNKQQINNFIKATLICLGISLVVLQNNLLRTLFTLETSWKVEPLEKFMQGFLS